MVPKGRGIETLLERTFLRHKYRKELS
jgi:hypothetical protein